MSCRISSVRLLTLDRPSATTTTTIFRHASGPQILLLVRLCRFWMFCARSGQLVEAQTDLDDRGEGAAEEDLVLVVHGDDDGHLGLAAVEVRAEGVALADELRESGLD